LLQRQACRQALAHHRRRVALALLRGLAAVLEVLGAVDEDTSGDPAGSTNDPADPADPTELPRTGLPAGLALVSLLPLGLYAKRKK
jgi:hypothetical protein